MLRGRRGQKSSAGLGTVEICHSAKGTGGLQLCQWAGSIHLEVRPDTLQVGLLHSSRKVDFVLRKQRF